MTNPLAWTEMDVLHVVQCLAQAHSGKSHRQVGDTSLFVEMQNTSAFSAEQIATLATEALHFFALNADEQAAGQLHRALTEQTPLADWAKMLFAHWDRATVCFRSSGSTGIPTRHPTPLALLAEEVLSCAPRFQCRRRVISVMPVHHIYGMVYGPILSKCMGVPLLFAPPLPLSSFFALLQPGDFVVAFPLFWKALLTVCGTENPVFPPVPHNVAGLTATSPCPPEVLRALVTAPQEGTRPLLSTMTEIYGSTETSAIGMRCDGEPWYTLLPCWECLASPHGVTHIRRTRSFSGDALPLPDVVVWNGARHFKPERRVDNAVQVGGINVYPQKIAALIRTHPLVRECAVRLMRPEEGVRLKAFIVPTLPVEEAARAFGKSFRLWLAAHLDAASRPKRITLGTALPTTTIGKASDWE